MCCGSHSPLEWDVSGIARRFTYRLKGEFLGFSSHAATFIRASDTMPVPIGKSPTDPFTILVSDDDHRFRRSIQLMLCSCGYTVRSYTSGSALLADPQAMCGHCLVADDCMTDIDGFAILEALRVKGWCGKAIMVSANCDQSLHERARKAGFDEVFAKPLVARAIIDAIARYARSTKLV